MYFRFHKEYFKKSILLFLLLIAMLGYGQSYKIPDSLKNKSYKNLIRPYYKIMLDTAKSMIYLNTLLQKAKNENDSAKMARGYTYLSYYAEEEFEKLTLLDSAINVSKDLQNRTFPTLSYSFKGGYFEYKRDFKSALDNYLLALDLAQKNSHTEFIYITKHNIAFIKGAIGKNDEALTLFKECLEYEKKFKPLDTANYLISIVDISESYMKNKFFDSATIFHKEGIRYVKNKFKNRFYGLLVFNEGVNLFHKKEYKKSSDSIDKGISLIRKINHPENTDYSIYYPFYKGKIAQVSNDSINAERYFLKMDSITKHEKITLPETREAYTFLVNYYKENKDYKNQLKYIERLLQFDSIVSNEYKFLSKKIITEFDTPQLISEKNELIVSLTKDKSTISQKAVFLLFLLVTTLFGLIFYYHKQQSYKKKFLTLYSEISPSDNKEKIPENSPAKSLELPKETINTILEYLNIFEQQKEYLKQNILSTDVANKIGTNPKYLSMVINTYKEKNFRQYINDLRVNYALKRLRSDKTFRKYTVKAIALEIGFNNPEAFSKAFYKNTGIYPSFFIKKIDEHIE